MPQKAKPPAAKDGDVFSNARKTSSQTPKTTPPDETIEASSMANAADVLTKLKSLRSEFGSKLDGINNQLGELRNTVSVMVNSLGEITKQLMKNVSRGPNPA